MPRPGAHTLERIYCHHSNPNPYNYFLEKLGDVIAELSGFESTYDTDAESHCLRNQIVGFGGFGAFAAMSTMLSLATYGLIQYCKKTACSRPR